MRRIIQRQTTTIQIVSVEVTWSESDGTDQPAAGKTVPTLSEAVSETKSAGICKQKPRRPRKVRPQGKRKVVLHRKQTIDEVL